MLETPAKKPLTIHDVREAYATGIVELQALDAAIKNGGSEMPTVSLVTIRCAIVALERDIKRLDILHEAGGKVGK